jgi:hypothetical protein
MLCPECDWFWDYEDDGKWCPFCSGAIGLAGPDDPEEAHKAVAEARE